MSRPSEWFARGKDRIRINTELKPLQKPKQQDVPTKKIRQEFKPGCLDPWLLKMKKNFVPPFHFLFIPVSRISIHEIKIE